MTKKLHNYKEKRKNFEKKIDMDLYHKCRPQKLPTGGVCLKFDCLNRKIKCNVCLHFSEYISDNNKK